MDAKLVQLCRSIAVVPRPLGLEMLPAIEFDDDSSAHAVEVNDVIRDGDLPPELEAYPLPEYRERGQEGGGIP